MAPGSFHRWTWPLYQRYLARSKAPILVGPWRSEIGFETLYWLPFLDAFRTRYRIDPARLIPITCGGAAVWYRTPHGIDLCAMRPLDEIRRQRWLDAQVTGIQKQLRPTPWDRAVYADAAKTLGLTRYHTLHPSWMYQTLSPFWEGEQGLQWLQRRARFTQLDLPPLPEGLTLPPQFVAVKFYARSTWPPTRETAVFADAVLAQISQICPVVLIDSGVQADEHLDYVPRTLPPRVLRLSDLVPLTPDTNLAIQSAVMARSAGFVGTYGGIVNLAVRFKKPTLSLYVDWHGTVLPHRHLLEALALQMGVPCHILKLGDVPALQQLVPQMVRAGASS